MKIAINSELGCNRGNDKNRKNKPNNFLNDGRDEVKTNYGKRKKI